METYDVIVIGGGQSGLAVGYYLRRSGLNYIILDKEERPGGSWQHYWKSLRLFSPAQWSSLPGILMPGGADYYPSRQETIQYLQHYEEKYRLAVKRPVVVEEIKQEQADSFMLYTSAGAYKTSCVVSATGSFSHPYLPAYPGMEDFRGEILHSASYKGPEPFQNKRVAIVGAGNSGAQILAELSEQAQTWWICSDPPSFLPDEVDGRVLFDAASAHYKARQEGRSYTPPSLGDIVVVPPVKKARERGSMQHNSPIDHFTPSGISLTNGREYAVDTVIFCTGFRPALSHLKSLGLVEEGKVQTMGTRSRKRKGLWLVGYGSWTGFASATLIGVGRSAKKTVDEIQEYIREKD